ncbi:RNA polymerase sigma factor [Planctomyces sp. SH-PL62]|uniref:RNA polymerase sigma factor n=1 Tax=Planctomyces sp. SH-PL62 TaxID=1636152 RepID=UPI00078E9F75|nr:RNA polymerase sigma factor [Planctomyces sp. SH-PL62]AMV36553.1 ECF RNA polymerase sigma factor SigE [Planctomyces sp. SH-PL62]
MTRARDGVGRRLQSLLEAGTVGDLSDGRLLERFLTRDRELAEAAFASLMERHGPMVWRVCRSILADPNDADDAYQATFLVMVRRSRSLRVRDSLGPWLHQVARRTALRARKRASQRRLRERAAVGDRSPLVEEKPSDDLAVIHEEIDRLPGRYRAAVVVCLLEGLPDEQAAIRLGCPPGTVHSRLARGRERLRRSLARRGVAPGLILAGPRIATEAASSVVPPHLVEATLLAASRIAAGGLRSAPPPAFVAALLEGVSRMFWLAHARIGLAALMLGGAVVATTLGPQEGGRPAPEEAIRPEPPVSAAPRSRSPRPRNRPRGPIPPGAP